MADADAGTAGGLDVAVTLLLSVICTFINNLHPMIDFTYLNLSN
jgi:hypothetical protein